MTRLLTLDQAADYIASRLNLKLDIIAKRELKFGILQWRSTIIRRDYERNGASPHYVQTFITGLKVVDIMDNCAIEFGCPVLRTTTKVPVPIRTKNHPFMYVGTADFTLPFGYSIPEVIDLTSADKFTAETIKYTYRDGYIYVFNNLLLEYVGIRSAFENPEEVVTLCTDASCFDVDAKFPLPLDMLEAIYTGLLQKEWSLPSLTDNEIKIDSNANRNNQL